MSCFGKRASASPVPMGGTLGIVGGLIIGQAAVDANIVSPIVVIIVALTALCAFTIPNEGFASAFRLTKFYIIALSMFLGNFWFCPWCADFADPSGLSGKLRDSVYDALYSIRDQRRKRPQGRIFQAAVKTNDTAPGIYTKPGTETADF